MGVPALHARSHVKATPFSRIIAQFAEQPRNLSTIYSGPMRFDIICEDKGGRAALTRPKP